LNEEKIKVLLIEDNPGDARLLKEAFARAYSPIFEITHVDSLNAGLQHLAWEDFNVVFLDLSLPDATGIETLLQVQAVAPNRPILVLTGIDDEELAVNAMQKGAQDYLVKGKVDKDLLIRATRYAIERKRTEVERQRLVRRAQTQSLLVRRILDTVKEGILTLNEQSEVVMANPAGHLYLARLGGVRVGDKLTRLGNRDLSELLDPEERVLPQEVVLEGENKQVFEVHINPSPLGQEEDGCTLLIRDVTEARQIQVRAQKQERQAAVGQLASGIAHDFNNILGSILLYTEILMESPNLGEKDKERLKTIMNQSQRAAALTRQILDFSRSGLIEPYRIDLVPFLEQVAKLLGRTLPENIRLFLVRKENQYVVNADPGRLQQVIMNLAVNSRDAMPEGGELRIKLETFRVDGENPSTIPDMPEGEWVRMTVSDSGAGIPPDVLPHIFEPFYTTKAPGEGSGLGLAQVYGIVTQHEGYVDVKSDVGKGTSIYIYLPAHPGPVEDVVILDKPAQPGKSKVRLLVVEDDMGARTAVSEALRAYNYDVLSAANGMEAVKVVGENQGKIDLVISDLVMPGMSGVTLYKQLAEEYPEISILFMTGYPLKNDTRELLESGGVTWLAKPIHMRALVRAIQKVLKNEKPQVPAEVIASRR
jgi:two-component system cell cycle sensor histidine kinase/response regulator CckA